MHRAFLLLPLLILPCTIAAQDKPAPPVQVTWHGQSFFTVKSGQGTVVAFDPHLIEQYGRPEGIRADIILLSHNHNDHTQVSAIDNFRDKGVRIIPGLKGAGLKATWNDVNEKIKDVAIRNVGVYHDTSEGMERGRKDRKSTRLNSSH